MCSRNLQSFNYPKAPRSSVIHGFTVISTKSLNGRGQILTTAGSDTSNEQRRLLQAFLYMRDPANPKNPDSNHYAFPLPIVPVLDPTTMKVIRIDMVATGRGLEKKATSKAKPHPPKEYTPEHQRLRTDLKPLQVVQPEGTSFKATRVGETGQTVEWQKWFFRIGFNQREGMVLYDVCVQSLESFIPC